MCFIISSEKYFDELWDFQTSFNFLYLTFNLYAMIIIIFIFVRRKRAYASKITSPDAAASSTCRRIRCWGGWAPAKTRSLMADSWSTIRVNWRIGTSATSVIATRTGVCPPRYVYKVSCVEIDIKPTPVTSLLNARLKTEIEGKNVSSFSSQFRVDLNYLSLGEFIFLAKKKKIHASSFWLENTS